MQGGPATEGNVHRLKTALAAYVHQEFRAPIAAIRGYVELLAEEAARRALGDALADLARVDTAAQAIDRMVDDLLDPSIFGARSVDTDLDEFNRQLRHDLRTPINAIKGYSEMLLEDAAELGAAALGEDLTALLAATDALLHQIDDLVSFNAGGAASAGKVERGRLVSEVLRTIRPLDDKARAVLDAEPSTILVVDDVASNRDLLSRRLRRSGHRVETVADGRTALARLGESPFDLVLLDLMMPDMNGFEVLTRIKADPRTRHVPVIMISALDEIDSTVRCIEAGAEDYLAKPFNPVLLHARIGASLERKRLHDREQEALRELRIAKEESETLLLNILPESVVARIRGGETEIADRLEAVTILFSDIVGFSNFAAAVPAHEVIDLLSRVFSIFDQFADQHGLEKIKTIGDAYMVAGGLPSPRPDHAPAVARMALDMIRAVDGLDMAQGPRIAIRIGISSGPVVAGIIGSHKFAYDVWGNTVNIASRMESTGLPGQIQICPVTRALLGDRFDCRSRGLQSVKGIGEVETFLLEGERAP